MYIMAAPTVVLLAMFAYAPMAGLVLAFKNYNIHKGIFGSDWCGFKNLEFLFASTDTAIMIRNTILFNIVFLALNTILAVCLSLILGEIYSKKMKKVYQTIYMLPHFLSWAIIAIVLNAFLNPHNGYITNIVENMGYDGVFNAYGIIEIWPPLLVGLNAWKGVGYSAVMYLAVISGISTDYYEAAVLDGASRFQQAWYITIPHLRTIISITLIMSIGSIFRGDFGLFYVVTQNSGQLYPVTTVIDTYVFRALTTMSNVGMPAAVGLLQSVVGFIFVLLANKVVSKIDPDSAMF